MALSAPLKAPPKPKPITLASLLDQLDREWSPALYESFADDEATTDRATLACYYQQTVRMAVYWLRSGTYADPYRFEWPESAKQHRLYRMCTWLGSLSDEQAPAAREGNLARLLSYWPAYRDMAVPEDIVNHNCPLDYELQFIPYRWDALVGHWTDPDPEARHVLSLPQFSNQASEDFHLAALALLYLNRQCRYALADLNRKDV